MPGVEEPDPAGREVQFREQRGDEPVVGKLGGDGGVQVLQCGDQGVAAAAAAAVGADGRAVVTLAETQWPIESKIAICAGSRLIA